MHVYVSVYMNVCVVSRNSMDGLYSVDDLCVGRPANDGFPPPLS